VVIRWLARRACAREVAIGVFALMVWMIIVLVGRHSLSAVAIWDVLFLIGAPLGGAIGARVHA